jgi:hypothetical protein
LSNADRFAVSAGTRLLTRLCHEYPGLWARLERFETSWLGDRLNGIAVEKPIYVTGLARSGTTILLELISRLPGVATHRYRDFPPIWTPCLWNGFLDLVPNRAAQPHERPHADGIEITPESPEAMEETIWMRFFPGAHDPAASNVLGRDTRNEAFAEFYRRHIRKLLLVRGRQRYVAKGNYNVSRLGYLQELFPDARFVVPVRHPVSHVASLMRQHQLFSDGQRAHPASRDYLRCVGHFEFGLDRVPINMDGVPAISEVVSHWMSGDEAAGWAAYWSHVYGSLLDQIERDSRLREAVLIVRYEDLNTRPEDELRRVLNHCHLEVEPSKLSDMAARLREPGYYKRPFDSAMERRIMQATAPTMSRYGYASEPP